VRLRLIPLNRDGPGLAAPAISTMPAFPPVRAGKISPFPRSPIRIATRLEITGDSMLPVYRDGDRILVSPQGSLRRGDRVVAKTHAGEVMGQADRTDDGAKDRTQSFNPALKTEVCAERDRLRASDHLRASQ